MLGRGHAEHRQGTGRGQAGDTQSTCKGHTEDTQGTGRGQAGAVASRSQVLPDLSVGLLLTLLDSILVHVSLAWGALCSPNQSTCPSVVPKPCGYEGLPRLPTGVTFALSALSLCVSPAPAPADRRGVGCSDRSPLTPSPTAGSSRLSAPRGSAWPLRSSTTLG